MGHFTTHTRQVTQGNTLTGGLVRHDRHTGRRRQHKDGDARDLESTRTIHSSHCSRRRWAIASSATALLASGRPGVLRNVTVTDVTPSVRANRHCTPASWRTSRTGSRRRHSSAPHLLVEQARHLQRALSVDDGRRTHLHGVAHHSETWLKGVGEIDHINKPFGNDAHCADHVLRVLQLGRV